MFLHNIMHKYLRVNKYNSKLMIVGIRNIVIFCLK